MNAALPWPDSEAPSGLLIDTNLVVLFVVGAVNKDRIRNFKRTSKYDRGDYELLLRVIGHFDRLYTLAHVMAEVSNLANLEGNERVRARLVLKKSLEFLEEPTVTSTDAARDELFEGLGLVDAAVATLARRNGCAVLTDDLDLYLGLSRKRLPALYFPHVQASARGLTP